MGVRVGVTPTRESQPPYMAEIADRLSCSSASCRRGSLNGGCAVAEGIAAVVRVGVTHCASP